VVDGPKVFLLYMGLKLVAIRLIDGRYLLAHHFSAGHVFGTGS
jgi:hypothetical protein